MSMKGIDWQSAYGRAPDSLREAVVHALREEGAPQRRRRVSALVLAAALILLLGITALAVAGHMGLLSSWYSYDPQKSGDASGLITDRIRLTGAAMAHADVQVREAFYDGQSARFLVAVTPKETGDAFTWGRFSDSEPMLEEALAYGDAVLAVDCEATAPGMMRQWPDMMMSSYQREGGGLLFIFTHPLPEGTSPDALPVELTLSVAVPGEAAMLETGAFAFEIPQTAVPDAAIYPLDRDLESAHIGELQLSYTPLETTVVYSYRPLYRNHVAMGLVGEDGQVQPLASSLMDWEEGDDGMMRERIVWPTESALPERIVLWIYQTDEVIVLDTVAGKASVHPAKPTYTYGVPDLPPGTSYAGETTVHIEYDEEVTL